MKGRKKEAENKNIAHVALFSGNIIRREPLAYYMEGRIRTKSAISISLDNDVLAFFAGKDRSARINGVLRQYLRWKLGGQEENMFIEEIPDRQTFARAINVVQRQKGEGFMSDIMVALMREIE